MTLDQLRAAYPSLGFGLFAIEPGGPVTLEVYSGDDVYPFTGPSAAAAIDLAFPTKPEPPAAEPKDLPKPAPTNIFD